MLDITVSLVVRNQLEDLKRLMPTLQTSLTEVSSEVLLVDNGSTDGGSQYVCDHFPDTQVIQNPDQAGYGENHNLNLARAKGRYFVIMNTDMTVEPNVFSVLLDYMEKSEDVGIVSPKICNEDGSVQGLNKRYPTLLDLFLRRFVPKRFEALIQRRIDFYEMRDIGYEHAYEVPFLSGAFMFGRYELLKALGGFDSKFFLYFEDVDLCRRVQQTHRTMYCPDASIKHFWMRSAHKSWLFTYYFMRSAFFYFNRWGYKLY